MHEGAEVWLALADDSATSQVAAGENKGRHLHHVAILRSLRKIGSVKRGAAFAQSVEVPPSAGRGSCSCRERAGALTAWELFRPRHSRRPALRAAVRGGRLEARLASSAAAALADLIFDDGGRPVLRLAGRSYALRARPAT
jgi:hypothetical protein